MSTTVQANIIKLLQRVEPALNDGYTVISASNISTWSASAGEKYTPQRILDIYNDARRQLIGELRKSITTKQLSTVVTGAIQYTATLPFALSGSVSTATMPTGYIDFVSLSNASGTKILKLDPSYIQTILEGADPKYVQSSTNIFVFEIAKTLTHFGTYIPTASTYKLYYVGISDFVLTDITGGTTVETINDEYIPTLLDIAEALAYKLGNGGAK
jgi:hypothetical protein